MTAISKEEINRRDRIKNYDQNFITKIRFELKEVIEKLTSCSAEIIFSKSRKQPYTDIRHILICVMRESTNYPLEFIGAIFGRDHASVKHAIAKTENFCFTESLFFSLYKNIKEEVQKIDLLSRYIYIQHKKLSNERLYANWNNLENRKN